MWHGHPLGRRRSSPAPWGCPVPDTDLKIVDADTGTREMKTGEPGEICFKGPQVMKGYYKKPEETAPVLRDGWLYTGDIGFLDEDGYLTIVDRKKDMIMASGFNIFPQEIDEILFAHPKILEACTIGIPDPYRGETVQGLCRAQAGRGAREGRDHRLLQGKARRLQGAPGDRVHRGASQERGGQDPAQGTQGNGPGEEARQGSGLKRRLTCDMGQKRKTVREGGFMYGTGGDTR